MGHAFYYGINFIRIKRRLERIERGLNLARAFRVFSNEMIEQNLTKKSLCKCFQESVQINFGKIVIEFCCQEEVLAEFLISGSIDGRQTDVWVWRGLGLDLSYPQVQMYLNIPSMNTILLKTDYKSISRFEMKESWFIFWKTTLLKFLKLSYLCSFYVMKT